MPLHFLNVGSAYLTHCRKQAQHVGVGLVFPDLKRGNGM